MAQSHQLGAGIQHQPRRSAGAEERSTGTSKISSRVISASCNASRDALDSGPLYGREAIKKYYAELFQNVHFSNNRSPRRNLT